MNADIKKYKFKDGVPNLFEVDQKTVGKYLSTKALGSYEREDLTEFVSEAYSLFYCIIIQVMTRLLLRTLLIKVLVYYV